MNTSCALPETDVSERAVVEIDPSLTVQDVVARYPASLIVFKAFRVEACCDAGRSLEDAAVRAGITGAILVQALQDSLRVRV